MSGLVGTSVIKTGNRMLIIAAVLAAPLLIVMTPGDTVLNRWIRRIARRRCAVMVRPDVAIWIDATTTTGRRRTLIEVPYRPN